MYFAEEPFRPAPDGPLYQQIYAHLQAAILTGRLSRGAKMPSTRALAEELKVSRNTVLTAYEQLRAEGYIESVKGGGTFVACVLPDAPLTASTPPVPATAQPHEPVLPRPTLSTRARTQLTSPQIWPALPTLSGGRPRPFSLGMSALDAFPYKLWARLIVCQARRLSLGAITYQHPAGYVPLREAIAAHVTVSRQVHCTPDQVVIVADTQGGLDLAARMLLDAGDPVWMEDPGYVGARGAFSAPAPGSSRYPWIKRS